jgi:hypothetical protein
VTNYAGDLGIDQFLRDRGALFGPPSSSAISTIDRESFGIQVFHRHSRAVFRVLAGMRTRPRDGGSTTDLDDFIGRAGAGGKGQSEREEDHIG